MRWSKALVRSRCLEKNDQREKRDLKRERKPLTERNPFGQMGERPLSPLMQERRHERRALTSLPHIYHSMGKSSKVDPKNKKLKRVFFPIDNYLSIWMFISIELSQAVTWSFFERPIRNSESFQPQESLHGDWQRIHLLLLFSFPGDFIIYMFVVRYLNLRFVSSIEEKSRASHDCNVTCGGSHPMQLLVYWV